MDLEMKKKKTEDGLWFRRKSWNNILKLTKTFNGSLRM